MIGKNEVESRCVDDGKDGQQDASHHSQQPHGKIGQHEIEHQHDNHQGGNQKQFTTEAGL